MTVIHMQRPSEGCQNCGGEVRTRKEHGWVCQDCNQRLIAEASAQTSAHSAGEIKVYGPTTVDDYWNSDPGERLDELPQLAADHYGRGRGRIAGWRLFYEPVPGDVEDHFIVAGHDDVATALAEARKFLARS